MRPFNPFKQSYKWVGVDATVLGLQLKNRAAKGKARLKHSWAFLPTSIPCFNVLNNLLDSLVVKVQSILFVLCLLRHSLLFALLLISAVKILSDYEKEPCKEDEGDIYGISLGPPWSCNG